MNVGLQVYFWDPVFSFSYVFKGNVYFHTYTGNQQGGFKVYVTGIPGGSVANEFKKLVKLNLKMCHKTTIIKTVK